MPSTIVVDTSVLIDLARGGLVESALALPYEFVVPRLLLDVEVDPGQAEYLLSRGLRTVDLDGDVVSVAAAYLERTAAISMVDAFVLALARTSGAMLLTGDGPLRTLATSEGVDTHGLLWLLDRLEQSGTVGLPTLHSSLLSVVGNSRCRLPRDQVRVRLARYARATGSRPE